MCVIYSHSDNLQNKHFCKENRTGRNLIEKCALCSLYDMKSAFNGIGTRSAFETWIQMINIFYLIWKIINVCIPMWHYRHFQVQGVVQCSVACVTSSIACAVRVADKNNWCFIPRNFNIDNKSSISIVYFDYANAINNCQLELNILPIHTNIYFIWINLHLIFVSQSKCLTRWMEQLSQNYLCYLHLPD